MVLEQTYRYADLSLVEHELMAQGQHVLAA